MKNSKEPLLHQIKALREGDLSQAPCRLFTGRPPSVSQGLAIPQAFQDPGLRLISAPDARLVQGVSTPKLVHGDHIVHLPAARHKELAESEADAFVLSLDPGEPWPEDLRVGIRTADCLTWIGLWSNPRGRWLTAAHLGWRSFALGLHFKVMSQLSEHLGSTLTQSHYLGPCVFGKDYPCHQHDVGEALRKLDLQRQKEPGRLPVEPACYQAASPADATGEKLHPDLQLLCLLDFLRLGIPAADILMHRVNTAHCDTYPSHRFRGEKKQFHPKTRLLTFLELTSKKENP